MEYLEFNYLVYSIFILIYVIKRFQGCEPYRVPPCPLDEYGNSTCKGKPMETNHRCTRMCYGDQNLNFTEDHMFSMINLNSIDKFKPKSEYF